MPDHDGQEKQSGHNHRIPHQLLALPCGPFGSAKRLIEPCQEKFQGTLLHRGCHKKLLKDGLTLLPLGRLHYNCISEAISGV